MAELLRFRSLDALVERHSALLAEYASGDIGNAVGGAKEFVTRAVLTGAILESTADREAAQSRVDYWATRLLSGFGVSFEDTLLDDLDERELQVSRAEIAGAGRRIYESLSPQQAATFAALIAGIAARDSSGKVVSRALSHAEASALPSGEEILYKLRDAGVVRLTRQGDPPEEVWQATDTGAIAAWPEAMEWLDETRARQERRQSLRDAAEQWRASGRDRSGLLTGRHLRDAAAYTDLSQLEREFIQASQGSELSRARLRVAMLTAIVVLLAVALAMVGYAWRITAQKEEQAKRSLALKQQIAAKAPPEHAVQFECTARFDPAPADNFYFHVAVRGTASEGAGSAVYRIEYASNPVPLILFVAAQQQSAPPPAAVWTGLSRPRAVYALIEYKDPDRLPLLGKCGDIVWGRRDFE